MASDLKAPQMMNDTIGDFLGNGHGMLLVACLRKDSDLADHLRQLGSMAQAFGTEGLAVCYALEELLPYFTGRYGVAGTPTFLMIRGGDLCGTLLGKNPDSSLIRFITDTFRA